MAHATGRQYPRAHIYTPESALLMASRSGVPCCVCCGASARRATRRLAPPEGFAPDSNLCEPIDSASERASSARRRQITRRLICQLQLQTSTSSARWSHRKTRVKSVNIVGATHWCTFAAATNCLILCKSMGAAHPLRERPWRCFCFRSRCCCCCCATQSVRIV